MPTCTRSDISCGRMLAKSVNAVTWVIIKVFGIYRKTKRESIFCLVCAHITPHSVFLPVSASFIMSSTFNVEQIQPSMMFLVGRREWERLKKLTLKGVYDAVVQDKSYMSSIITFAVNFHAPSDILHFLCHLNTDALLDNDLPFRLARRNRSDVQTIIVLEGARQTALVKRFNSSASSSLSIAEIVGRSTRFVFANNWL